MNVPPFKNSILRSLDPETIARLQLKPLTLQSGREIENPGEPIEHLIFIEDGIGSMTNTFKDGFQVEVGMFGYESVMGASALMGTRRSLNKVYMQMSGHGLSCRMPLATLEFQRYGRFHDLVLRSVQATAGTGLPVRRLQRPPQPLPATLALAAALLRPLRVPHPQPNPRVSSRHAG